MEGAQPAQAGRGGTGRYCAACALQGRAARQQSRLAAGSRAWPTHVNLHLPVEAITQQKIVSHPDAVWLHGVPLPVIVVAYVRVVKVANL